MPRNERHINRIEPPAPSSDKYRPPFRRLINAFGNRHRIEEQAEVVIPREPSRLEETITPAVSPPSPPEESSIARAIEQSARTLEVDENDWQMAGANGRAVRPVRPPQPRPNAGPDSGMEWRGPRGANTTNGANDRPSHTIIGRNRNRNGTKQQQGGTNVDLGTDMNQVVMPGTIAWHKEMHAYHGDEKEADNPNVFKGIDGSLIIMKGRYFVVRSVHAHHWTEVPIYTYGRKGLEFKSEDFKKEHLCIRPCPTGEAGDAGFVNQNDYEPLEFDYVGKQKKELSSKAVVHFTEEMPCNKHTEHEIVGVLTAASMEHLKSLRVAMKCR